MRTKKATRDLIALSPSEFPDALLAPAHVAAAERPLVGLAGCSETCPAEVPAALVRRFRPDVGPCLVFAVFLQRAAPIAVRQSQPPLVSLGYPPESYPAHRGQWGSARSAPLLGFPSLQHIPAWEIHFPRACLTRYGPPSGFGYPRDGLHPPGPGRLCFAPTALMGLSLRSIPPTGSARCHHRRRSTCRFLAGCTRREASSRRRRPRLLDPTPARVAASTTRRLGRRACGGSHGFFPSKVNQRRP